MLGARRACGAKSREGLGGAWRQETRGAGAGRAAAGRPLPLQEPLGSALGEPWEVWTLWTLNPGDDNVGAGAAPGFPSPPDWSLVSPAGGPGAAGPGAAGLGTVGPGGSRGRGQQRGAPLTPTPRPSPTLHLLIQSPPLSQSQPGSAKCDLAPLIAGGGCGAGAAREAGLVRLRQRRPPLPRRPPACGRGR